MDSHKTAPTTAILPANLAARWLLALLLLAAAYFFIGFVVPLLAALVIGFASRPLYGRLTILCRGRTTFGYIINLANGQQLGSISRWVLTLSGGALNFLLAMLFMLISLFFVYKDGRHFAEQLDIVGERILPNRWQRFSRVVPATVSATVMGMALVAIGEGVVLGIAA